MFKKWGNGVPLSHFLTLQWIDTGMGSTGELWSFPKHFCSIKICLHCQMVSLDGPMVFLSLWLPRHHMSSSIRLNFLLWDWRLESLFDSTFDITQNRKKIYQWFMIQFDEWVLYWVSFWDNDSWSGPGWSQTHEMLASPLGTAAIIGACHHIWLWLSIFFLPSEFMS